MNCTEEYVTVAEAARRTGVSVKALKIYEQRGLIAPARTEAGWRVYGPDERERLCDIATLRGLGFSLASVGDILAGETDAMDAALAHHAETLSARLEDVGEQIARVQALRRDIASGRRPEAGELTAIVAEHTAPRLAFDLPWPWGGERFELAAVRPLTYIVGPLGSGKTRLARRIADAWPGAVFSGLDRAEISADALHQRHKADPARAGRVERGLEWLHGEGANASHALACLVDALEDPDAAALVIDMVEQDLDAPTQEAIAGFLKMRASIRRPVFVLTRSSAVLDLAAVGEGEGIVFCPANHAPPLLVQPVPGGRGYEGVASCLATPEVRARTAGVIAWRPPEPDAGAPRGGAVGCGSAQASAVTDWDVPPA